MNGDFTLGDNVFILFTTRAFATGIPGTLSAGATVAVYEDVTATPILTGVAVTESLNSVAGLNAVTIAATSANSFNAGGHYHVVIDSASTVDSVSVTGEVVGQFTLGASAAAVDLANGTDGLGAIKSETALIVADTNELQGDWTNTGRLDTILDAILDDTGTTLQNELDAQIAVDVVERDDQIMHDEELVRMIAEGIIDIDDRRHVTFSYS